MDKPILKKSKIKANSNNLFRINNKKTFNYIKTRGVRPFDYNINIEINNELTPETWVKKEF